MRANKRIRMAVNGLLAAAVAVGTTMMFLGGEGTLLSNGLDGLKYFTVLSNIFEGIASLLWLAFAARSADHAPPKAVEIVKYAAGVCVGLTFVTVMVFLGPLYGYPFMFMGANLFFHLLIPVAAMLEFVLMNTAPMTLRHNLAATLPTLLYGTVYLINILLNGVGEYPDTNDWYGFVNWGLPVGIVIFAVISAAAFVIGLALRLLNTMRNA